MATTAKKNWVFRGSDLYNSAPMTGYDESSTPSHNVYDGELFNVENGQVSNRAVWNALGYQGDVADVDNANGGYIYRPEFRQWLTDNGYRAAVAADPAGGRGWGGYVDRDGNAVQGTEYQNVGDNRFWNAALLAGAAVGASVAGAGAGAGAADGAVSGMDLAADAALGSGNNIYTAGSVFGSGGTAASGAGLEEFGGGGGDVSAGSSGSAEGNTGLKGNWNGTDFSGSTPLKMSSSLATGSNAVSTGLSVSDWLGIGSVAVGLLNKPDTPDTSGINAAAAQSAAQAQDAWNWFKTEYEKGAPDRAAATARDGKIADAQLDGMTFATAQAKELADRNKTVFQPLEDKLVAGAQAYDTPERRAAAVAESQADVEGAYGRAQEANDRAMLRMGATPGGAATAQLMQDASLQKAKAVAGSTSAATRNVEQQGYARMVDAAALGKGVVSSQATQQQIAANTGSAGVQAGAGQVAAANSGVSTMATGVNASTAALQAAGSLYGQAAGITSATRGQDLSLLNSAFSSYLKSDERVKSDTGDVTDGKKELDEVNAVPVEQGWRYDPAKGGPDDGGQQHTGPMAQKVRAKMGDAVAPGGTDIDMRAMGGKLMASVQQLSTQVTRLQHKVARMSPKKTAQLQGA